MPGVRIPFCASIMLMFSGNSGRFSSFPTYEILFPSIISAPFSNTSLFLFMVRMFAFFINVFMGCGPFVGCFWVILSEVDFVC